MELRMVMQRNDDAARRAADAGRGAEAGPAGPVSANSVPAPPTWPAPAMAMAVRSSWPTPVGVICVVLGVLGVLGGLVGMVSVFIPDWFSSFGFSPPGMEQALEVFTQHRALILVMNVVTTLTAGLLLFAGVGVVSRRGWARRACLWFSGVKIVVVVLNAALGWYFQQAQFRALPSGPFGASSSGGFFEFVTAIGVGVSVLWGWALPVFLIIWFNRGSIRAEVRSWDSGAQVTRPPELGD